MDAIELLKIKGDEIVDQATAGIVGAHLRHYDLGNRAQTRERLKTLCDLTLERLVKKSSAPMMKYAEKMAEERFSSGFSLREIQTAFNVLEESICSDILSEMQPAEYAAAVGLISTALRIGKESATRTYLAHVTKCEVPSLDFTDIFSVSG